MVFKLVQPFAFDLTDVTLVSDDTNCNHDLQVDAIMDGKVSVAIRISSCICTFKCICIYLCICTCICDLQVDATFDGWRGSVCSHSYL